MADKYLENPANEKLISLLSSFGRGRPGQMSADPATVKNPYFTLGTHPDIVERVWAVLGGGLPVDCRWVLCGRPVLAHPVIGTAFAFAMGTPTYALWLPPGELAIALAEGASRSFKFSNGHTLDLTQLGDDWVMGGWRQGEVEWCAAAFKQLNAESVHTL